MVDYDVFDNQTVYYKSSENMSEIKDNSIDVIVSSPPYNRNKLYSDDRGGIYNDKKPQEEYFRFLTTVWRECYRVLNPRGVFFLNIGDAAPDQGISENVAQLAVKTGFHRLQTIIWIKSFLGKGHFTPSGGSRRLNNLWESIFVLVKDRKKYHINPKAIGIPYADKSNIGRYANEDLRDAGNVWLVPYSKTTGATIKKGHEAPFPVELPYKCIKLAEGETVLDPFVGIGSTLAASRLLKKKGFGYEKFPRKELIKKRILEGSFKETPSILLPHLELAINILSRYSSIIEYSQLHDEEFFKFSHKEKIQLNILKDTLNQLNLRIPFLEEYFLQWDHNREKLKSKKRIEVLTKFLDESK
ncbi:MAG: site-specific DNA-methyltransferase [Candidatus Heimdallarchaeota archaeon]|nr:MAG: site-specific DNA-methyltransferase [Candidatus Heimdallarchaeota archaeon]